MDSVHVKHSDKNMLNGAVDGAFSMNMLVYRLRQVLLHSFKGGFQRTDEIPNKYKSNYCEESRKEQTLR